MHELLPFVFLIENALRCELLPMQRKIFCSSYKAQSGKPEKHQIEELWNP